MAAQPQPRPAARAPQTQQASERTRLIRLVHVGRRELQLDECAYRTILQAQGGANSSALMSVGQLQRVVDYLKRQGFKVATKAKPAQAGVVVANGRRSGMATVTTAVTAVTLASDPQSRKARALWLMLHAIGAVRDPSETALQAYGRRQCGVDRLEWVRDAFPLIESLKAWALRALPAYVLPYVEGDVTHWAGHMSPAWRENWAREVAPLKNRTPQSLARRFSSLVAVWELISSAQSSKSATGSRA